jgi:hypothetical protein
MKMPICVVCRHHIKLSAIIAGEVLRRHGLHGVEWRHADCECEERVLAAEYQKDFDEDREDLYR